MKDFKLSKKWLLIIFSISISVILVSSQTVPVFGHNEASHSIHDDNLDADKKAILLKFSGNKGSTGFIRDALDPLETFMDKNEGTHHDSVWNKWHYPDIQKIDDGEQLGISYPEDCPTPCNWINAKQNALDYIKANPQKKIVLAGYSFGGGTATFLGSDLQKFRQVEGIFLTDPVGPGILGSSRAGIMQVCDIDNDTPIDSFCTRSISIKCANHGSFKLVGGFVICGKDMNPCPLGADRRAFVAGEGWLCIETGPIDTTVNCPFGGTPGAFGLCYKNWINVSTCPTGYSFPGFGLCSAQPSGVDFNCPNGMHPNAINTECIAFQTCPSQTSFNVEKSECVVRTTSGNSNVCPFGMVVPPGLEHRNECGPARIAVPGTPPREMNSNIKGIIVNFQKGDPAVPADAASWDFKEWGPDVDGTFGSFEFNCGTRGAFCHSDISEKAPAQDVFIAHLKTLNKKPTISIAPGTDLEIREGESAPDGLTMVSTDDTGVSETIGNMKLFLRLDSLNNGIEPSSQTDEFRSGNTIQKEATFTINIDSADGPGSHTRTVWVEDNGWPCDDCTATSDSIDSGATGKWNKVDVTFTVLNVPPTPVLVGDLSQARAKEFTFNAIDPSSADQAAGFKYAVTWWDGKKISIDKLTVGDVTFPTPQIRVPGEYTFQVTAEDKDNGVSKPVSFTISIPDTDGDGIADDIDTLPEEFSDDFSDVNFCKVGIPNVDSGLCEIEPTCSIGNFNIETDKCETEPLCDNGFLYVPETNFCEFEGNPSEPFCIDKENQDFNPDTDACESSRTCPDGTTLNSEINMCVAKIIPGDTDGTINDRGNQDISILEEQNSEGIFFNADEGGGENPATIIACDKAGQIEVDSGDSGNITCGSITVSIVTGSVDVQFNTGAGPATTTMGASDSITFDGDTLTFTNNSLTNTAVIKIAGRTITLAPGETITVTFPTSKTSYQDPNLGDVRHGQGHDNGFCMNQNCINVDGFFNHFPETIVRQGSTQTFSLLINCPRGVDTCNHATIEGVLPDSDFYEEQWGVTLNRLPRSDTWETTINNPYGEIGEVTTTVQEVGQSFLSVSFNIEFLIPGSIGTADGIRVAHENNRFLHVTVWDSNRGISNYIFNEGVYVDDIYAYPKVEASYDAPLEIEKLCLNENTNKRYTCAFDKVREWTIKNAEKALLEIKGITELDVLNEEFLSKFKELKQAIADDDSEKISELRMQLDELGIKIHNMKQ